MMHTEMAAISSQKRNLHSFVKTIVLMIVGALTIGAWGINHVSSDENGMMISSVLLLLAYILLLISEVFPVSLSSMIIIGLMPFTGVTGNLSIALSGFSNQVVAFILASYGIAQSLTETPISKRILKCIMKLAGSGSRRIILAFMLSAAAVSSVVSSVPTCAVFLAITLEFLNLFEGDQKKQNGKILMIGIPIASMIGGVITPAGSSVNILALSILEEQTGETIRFIQWTAIGLPVALILVLIAWALLVHIYHPSEMVQKDTDRFIQDLHIPDKIQSHEKKVILILSISFLLMLLSSWIPAISVMTVSVLSCAVLCLPKIGVLNTKQFLNGVSWDAIFLVGTVLSFSFVMNENGVSQMMASHFPEIGNLPLPIALLCVSFLMFLFLLFIPVAPSLIAIMLPVLIQSAENSGMSVCLITFVSTICIVNCYLLPLDTVCLLSYGHGYYKMLDMTKITLPLQIACAIIISLISYFGFLILY